MSFECLVLLALYSQVINGGSSLNVKKIERIGKTEERKASNIVIHNYYEFGQCVLNPIIRNKKDEDINSEPTVEMKGSSSDSSEGYEAPVKTEEDIELNDKVPLNVFVDGKKLEDVQNSENFERKKQQKINVSHFKLIIDDVENNIDEMRVYVPDGISGPLNRYFQRLEAHQARHAYKNGVVRLSNGILIPLKTVITVVDFRNWLKRQKNSNVENHRKDSYTTPIYNFNEFIMYLVNFKFVNVILPNSHLVPLIDCQSYLDQLPIDAKKRVILDIVGFEMPLSHFEQCLKLQC